MQKQIYHLTEENDVYIHLNGKSFPLIKYYQNGIAYHRFIEVGGVCVNTSDDASIYYEDVSAIKDRATQSLKPYRKAILTVLFKLAKKDIPPLVLLNFDDITYKGSSGEREFLKLQPCYIVYRERNSDLIVMSDVSAIADTPVRPVNPDVGAIGSYVDFRGNTQFKIKHNPGQGHYAHGVYQVRLAHPTGMAFVDFIFDQPIHLDCQFLYPKRAILSKELVAEYVAGPDDESAKVIFYHLGSNHLLTPIGVVNYEKMKTCLPLDIFGVWDKSESD